MHIEAFKQDHLLWTLSPPQSFFHSFFFVLTFLFHSSVCLHSRQLSNYHPLATADYLVHFRKKANTCSCFPVCILNRKESGREWTHLHQNDSSVPFKIQISAPFTAQLPLILDAKRSSYVPHLHIHCFRNLIWSISNTETYCRMTESIRVSFF